MGPFTLEPIMSQERSQPAQCGRGGATHHGHHGHCGAQDATALPDPTADQGKVFNLDNLSDSDSAATLTNPLPNDGTTGSDNTLITPNTNVAANILMNTSTLGKIPDIKHFFNKKPSGSTCKVCKYVSSYYLV